MNENITEPVGKLRKLYGAEDPMPVAVAKCGPRLSAYDFSKETYPDSGFMHGMTRENAAASLRSLADAIEQKRALPMSVRVMTIASQEDFTHTVLRFVFAEKS